MILHMVNSFLECLTRPYVYIQKYILVAFQTSLPTHFDEKSWYILFGCMIFSTFIIAYILNRCMLLQDADDDPIYQRTRLYSKSDLNE